MPTANTQAIADVIHQLGSQVRDTADEIHDHDAVTRGQYEQLKTAVALLDVLRRRILGSTHREIAQAFGPVGDWGYDTPIGLVLEQVIAESSKGPGPIEAHCSAVTDPPPVPADADRIAARLAGQRPPVVADARRGAVIVSDHQDAVLSRDSRIGVCSKDATDEQLRAAVGLGVDMSGLPRVERRPIPGMTHLQAFTVTGYTGD